MDEDESMKDRLDPEDLEALLVFREKLARLEVEDPEEHPEIAEIVDRMGQKTQEEHP